MFRNILNTTIVRILNAIVTFLILMINARMLGPEKLGTIGLILLAVTIILLLNNFIGGGALVFLVPRYSMKRIILISYLWTLVATVLGIMIFTFLKIEPVSYTTDIFLLALIYGFCFVNQNVLVGKGLIRYFNMISFIQYLVLIILVLVLFYVLKDPTIDHYLLALYISWSLHMVLGMIRVFKECRLHPVQETQGLLKAMLKYGFFIQLANLTQFFNYRLTYYFVESFLGRAKLGVFEIGNKLADGVWLFSKSISMVQYSWIANANDQKESVAVTLRLFRFSFVLSLMLVLVMIALPESFYLAIFGAKFQGLYSVILYLSPGIVFLSANMILAHYFAGMGKYYINTIGSVIGLCFIILFGFLLVPDYRMGLPGASLAASLTNLITLIYGVVLFKIETHVQWRDFVDTRHDFVFLKDLYNRQMNRLRKG